MVGFVSVVLNNIVCLESLTRTRLSLTKSFFALISSALKEAHCYAYCETFVSNKDPLSYKATVL